MNKRSLWHFGNDYVHVPQLITVTKIPWNTWIVRCWPVQKCKTWSVRHWIAIDTLTTLPLFPSGRDASHQNSKVTQARKEPQCASRNAALRWKESHQANLSDGEVLPRWEIFRGENKWYINSQSHQKLPFGALQAQVDVHFCSYPLEVSVTHWCVICVLSLLTAHRTHAQRK